MFTIIRLSRGISMPCARSRSAIASWQRANAFAQRCPALLCSAAVPRNHILFTGILLLATMNDMNQRTQASWVVTDMLEQWRQRPNFWIFIVFTRVASPKIRCSGKCKKSAPKSETETSWKYLKIKGVANKAIESTQNVATPFSWFAFALVETWFAREADSENVRKSQPQSFCFGRWRKWHATSEGLLLSSFYILL